MDKTTNPAEQYLQMISLYEREFKSWENRVQKLLRKYREDSNRVQSGTKQARYNIFWSNVQTAIPAVYSRLPQPDVSRRHRDQDGVGRVAAMILERGLEFEINHYPDFRAAMSGSVFDRFIGGRGTAWVRYEPHMKAVSGEPLQGVQVTEDSDEAGEEKAEEEIEYECAPTDYVHWRDFGHSIGRTWEEVTQVWRRVYMGKAALIARFGEEVGNSIPLDTRSQDKKDSQSSYEPSEAIIYEIWDKETRTAVWLSKSMSKIIDERDDPLGLENFWPCARPLFGTLTTESLVPTPDYVQYQDQAEALNDLEDRIEGLIKALQIKGVYNSEIPELARLFTEGQSGNLLPVSNWQAFAEKQGLKGALDLVDLTPIFMALKASYEALDNQKQQIYEITGMADIIRGSTDPNETLGAQKLKGQFGSMRLRAMQRAVSQFATELLQIKAQIMCKHFQPETLAQIASVQTLNPADQQFVQPALQLLKQSTLRDFRIEVAADSMVQIDEQQEKEDASEFLNAVGGFLQKVAQVPPAIAPMAGEMLKWGVSRFPIGKSLEGALDQGLDQLRQQAAQPQQAQPNPKVAEINAKAQADIQVAQEQGKVDQQTEQISQQAQAQQMSQQQQNDAALKQLEARLNDQNEQTKAAMQRQLQEQQQQFELRLKMMENAHQQAQAQLRPPLQ